MITPLFITVGFNSMALGPIIMKWASKFIAGLFLLGPIPTLLVGTGSCGSKSNITLI